MSGQNTDSLSYSLGVIIAQNVKQQGIEGVNADKMAKAINDVLKDQPLEISFEKSNQIFGGYVQQMKMKEHEGNKKAGEDFLAMNKSKAGVTTTASGLQYEIIKPGAGAKPALTSKVKVHYHGTLITGEVFDSSVDRGEPISFPLTGVIQGWQEGVQLMPVGAKYRFFIPYDLAYGERGSGGKIAPYSALVFDVELLDIEQ
jgi:FKBP-type peptidyl-prolyl cis-trans isomerase FklB